MLNNRYLITINADLLFIRKYMLHALKLQKWRTVFLIFVKGQRLKTYNGEGIKQLDHCNHF